MTQYNRSFIQFKQKLLRKVLIKAVC